MQNKDDDHHNGGQLPDPAIRHWRHPSELAGLSATATQSVSDRGLGVGSLAAIGALAFGGAVAILVYASLVGVPVQLGGNLSTDAAFESSDRDGDTVGDTADGAAASLALPSPESADDLTTFSQESSDEQTDAGNDDGSEPDIDPAAELDDPIANALAVTGVFSSPTKEGRLASFLVVDGMILTSASALQGRSAVWLALSDQWTGADVIGHDVYTDVAVIRPAQWLDGLTELSLHPTEGGVGQDVAIDLLAGQLDEDQPVRWTGAISSTNDAAENGSGRAWFDSLRLSIPSPHSAAGAAVLAETGGAVGMAIDSDAPLAAAVPLATAADVARSLVTIGCASPAWIGVEVTTDESGETRLLNIDPNSPARDLLQPDDVVVSVNHAPLQNADHLVYIVRSTEIGADLDLVVSRNGLRSRVAVTVGTAPTKP